ncbi:MAG TPA: GIY-YIG nuclease family protein [Caldilinea sp.]|nr:GIY-YIG nuclease family protein [Caldilinea sp.]
MGIDKHTKLRQLATVFFQTIAEGLVLDDDDCGMPVILRELRPHAPYRLILTREEAKIAYESHLIFCDSVGDTAIAEFNAAAASDDPYEAHFEKKDFSKGAWVYLIGASNSEYKIGWSRTPERRVDQVVAPSGGPKTLIHTFQCGDALRVEGALHQVFARKRIEREWFALSDADVEWIKTITEWP